MSVTIESAATVGIPSSIGSAGRPRSGIVVHYVGGNAITRGSHASCRQQVRNWHSYHRNGNGWAGLGYNYCLCWHGIVMTGRGLNRVGAHAPGANATHVGVLIMLGGTQQPTSDQLAGFRAFRTWLGRQGVGTGITPHSRWVATSCPGNHLRSRISSNNWGSGGTPGGPGGGGGGGVRSVSAIQRAVNALGYTPALVVDGIDGPLTQAGVRWLQGRVGAAVDGVWGPETERLYLAYLEDDLPTRDRFTWGDRAPIPLVQGEWVQMAYGARNGADTGAPYHSFAGLSSNAMLYDISAGWRITGLEAGAEYQTRFVLYDPPTGDGPWTPSLGLRLHEHKHRLGDAFNVHTDKGRVDAARRVRLEIKIHTDSPDARVIGGSCDAFTWHE